MLRRERGGKGRMVALIAAGAVAVATAGVTVVLVTGSHGHARTGAAAHPSPPVPPLHVLSVTPAPDATGVSGVTPIQVQLAAADPRAATPQITPDIPGTWQRAGRTLTFTPQTGFAPQTTVTLSAPAASGTWTDSYTTGSYSMLRLQQLLAQLGYLPLNWTADLGGAVSPDDQAAQLAAAYQAPVGTFSWRGGYPSALTRFWHQGQDNLITTGAIMAFESQHGMKLGETITPALWTAVLGAVGAQRMNSSGYTYALVSKSVPETITIWHNGRDVFRSYVNTGIPVRPTANGTYPVYLRYYFQIMQGFNPGGSHYADPVYYVSYFDGGEAVHYFPRGGYGYPQSLGCVELPWSAAARAWPYLTYGSLVTVTY